MSTTQKRGSTYKIYVSCGYSADGRQIRKTMTWRPPAGLTERQTEKELNRVSVEFENQVKSGNYASGRNTKLADFCKEYLVLTKATLAPTTWASYSKIINQRIIPALGHLKIVDIRPLHVQRFIQMLEEKGQYDDIHYVQWTSRAEKLKKAGKPVPPAPKKQEYLSPATIKRIHAVLQSILARALKFGLISSNPAAGERIDLPKIENDEVQILDKERADAVLAALESEPIKYQVMIHLALSRLQARRTYGLKVE